MVVKISRKPRIRNAIELFSRMPYRRIIDFLNRMEKLKMDELRYLLLKNHGLKMLKKRKDKYKYLDDRFKKQFQKEYEFNESDRFLRSKESKDYTPQDLNEFLRTLRMWEVVEKKGRYYKLTTAFKCRSVINSLIKELESHPPKSIQLTIAKFGERIVLGFNEKLFEVEEMQGIEDNLSNIDKCLSEIKKIVDKSKHPINILVNIFPEYELPQDSDVVAKIIHEK